MCRDRERTWDSFLEGYQQVKAISAADLAAVELFYGIRRLWSLGMRAGLVRLQGMAAVCAYIDSRLASLREWVAAREREGWQGVGSGAL
jgi:hypothetical protein